MQPAYRLTTLLLFVVIFSSAVSAQIPLGANIIFYENFDAAQSAWNMSTTTIPVNNTDTFYRETVVTKNGSAGAATDTVDVRTTSYLTSPLMRVDVYSNVFLSFDQICYVDRLNLAKIEYSFSTSSSWNTLPDSTYRGTSFYSIPLFTPEVFNKRSNPIIWPFTTSTFVYTASTNAWVNEVFELTGFLASRPAADSLIQFRFSLENSTQSLPGRVGLHRWIIDNFLVYEDNATNLQDVDLVATISAYPNPATDQLNISNESESNITIRITDLLSKELFNLRITAKNRLELDVSHLPKGLYLLETTAGNQRRLQKIVIQ